MKADKAAPLAPKANSGVSLRRLAPDRRARISVSRFETLSG